MKRLYLILLYRFKHRLWVWWHCDLPHRVFKRTSVDVPWWHLCCVGNCGGWRTSFCDWLEGYPNGWRGLEYRLYLYEEEEE